MIIVDSNVLIDLIDSPGTWTSWSQDSIEQAALADRLAIDHVILAELHARPDTAIQFERLRLGFEIAVIALDDPAAQRAGEAFGRYRRHGGIRTSILADFLIGGHCVALGATLLTRDGARFASYFPELTLITPETAP